MTGREINEVTNAMPSSRNARRDLKQLKRRIRQEDGVLYNTRVPSRNGLGRLVS